MNLLEKLKLIKESKAKSLRNLGSQFGISVGAVNYFLKRKREYKNLGIGVNRPAIVREIPHFGLFPAFPHFCQNVPHFWLYF